MFQWDKSTKSIDIPAERVVHLFRSMREVQLALPGVSAQQASSFLCQYKEGKGVATVAVFHLHKSKVLSFYFSDPRIVDEQKTDSMLDQGLNFVESMGFLMTDQDIHLLDVDDQVMLWESLPLKAGLEEEDETPPAETPSVMVESKPDTEPDEPRGKSDKDQTPKGKTVAAQKQESTAADTSDINEDDETSVAVSEKKMTGTASEPVDNVDDLLAAVEAMRAKRPGLRARKSAPSPEEMENRRLQLRATVGRIWASL